MAAGVGPMAGVYGAGLHTQPGAPSAHTELTAQLRWGHSQHPLSHGARLGTMLFLVCLLLIPSF